MAKKWFWGQKLSFLRYTANMALNAHFLAKNHFFTITTPKPGYIYLNNFFWENFSKKKFGPLGPPLGYLGSLSQNRLGKIFSKCGFLNLLSPLGLPIPSYALLLAKKLKKIPRGCDFLEGRVCCNSLAAPKLKDLVFNNGLAMFSPL